MRQTTLSEGSFAKHAKQTRKEKFLLRMARIIPWDGLSKAIEPRYPKPEGSGRRPAGVERMLRIHLMRHWLDLSGPGLEDALYDLPCLRQFARIGLGRETAPDETATCKFRHIPEGAGLGERLFYLVNDHVSENRLFASKGALVDATLIERPRPGIRRDETPIPFHQGETQRFWTRTRIICSRVVR